MSLFKRSVVSEIANHFSVVLSTLIVVWLSVVLVRLLGEAAAGRIGADVDEALWLNLAGGRDDGFQIAQADGFDRDRRSGRLPEVVTRAGRRSTEDDDRQHDEDLLVHATLQKNGDVRANRRTESLLSGD